VLLVPDVDHIMFILAQTPHAERQCLGSNTRHEEAASGVVIYLTADLPSF
jgi:hypothetical protein